MGKEVSHADATLFGWYAFSWINIDIVEKAWEIKKFTMIQKWLRAIMECG